jgi:hypothetical protein
MRTIIAGSRGVADFDLLKETISKIDWKITTVLSGTARGVDQLGEQYARDNKIPLERYPAKWNLYGKAAGFRRNQQMAIHADALIALWDGESRGTKHMIDIAKEHNLKIYVLNTKKEILGN